MDHVMAATVIFNAQVTATVNLASIARSQRELAAETELEGARLSHRCARTTTRPYVVVTAGPTVMHARLSPLVKMSTLTENVPSIQLCAYRMIVLVQFAAARDSDSQ
jgi:hypothetical protein